MVNWADVYVRVLLSSNQKPSPPLNMACVKLQFLNLSEHQ